MKKSLTLSLSLVAATVFGCAKKSNNPFETQSLYCEGANYKDMELMRTDLPREYMISLSNKTGEAVLQVYDMSHAVPGKGGIKLIEERKDCGQAVYLYPDIHTTLWTCPKPGAPKYKMAYPEAYEVTFGDKTRITTFKLYHPDYPNDRTWDHLIQTTEKCWMGPKKVRPPRPQ